MGAGQDKTAGVVAVAQSGKAKTPAKKPAKKAEGKPGKKK